MADHKEYNADSRTATPIDLLGRRVKVLVDPQGFRPSMDSVMLAAACPAVSGDTVLDMGCGSGAAGFCLMARVEGVRLIGVDRQEHLIQMAREGAKLNGFSPRTEFDVADIRSYTGPLCDRVICNPPFLEAGHFTPAREEGRAIALGHVVSDEEEVLSLDVWIKAALRRLKNGGSLTLIHRADHIVSILASLHRRFGAIELIPLYPKRGQPSKRLIVRAIKGRKTLSTLHEGLILHEDNGALTVQAEAVLSGAQKI